MANIYLHPGQANPNALQLHASAVTHTRMNAGWFPELEAPEELIAIFALLD